MSNTPTPSAKLDEVTAAIMKAVPEIGETCRQCTGFTIQCYCSQKDFRPITLEDVLRALQGMVGVETGGHFAVSYYGEIFEMGTDSVLALWTLGLPLHQQSPETIDFLHQLLCPKE